MGERKGARCLLTRADPFFYSWLCERKDVHSFLIRSCPLKSSSFCLGGEQECGELLLLIWASKCVRGTRFDVRSHIKNRICLETSGRGLQRKYFHQSHTVNGIGILFLYAKETSESPHAAFGPVCECVCSAPCDLCWCAPLDPSCFS